MPAECQLVSDIALEFRSELGEPIPPYVRPRRADTLRGVCRDSLFPLVDQAIPRADLVERRAVAVLSYLAVQGSSLFPYRLVANRLQIIEAERCRIRKVAERDLLAEDVDLLVELVLALALGWWPQHSGVKKVRTPEWEEPWPIALQELIQMATEIVDHGALDLQAKGLDVPAGLPQVCAWAEQAAHDFVLGPLGGSAKGSATFRYLAFWQPGPCRNGEEPGRRKLVGWLRHAVYGDSVPLPRVKPNKARNGLLYPLMKDDGCLKLDKKAFQICWRCGSKKEYDGTPCNECAQSDDPAPYIVRGEDVLLVPGQYLPKVFRRIRPAAISPDVQARLRPSEKTDPEKLKLYAEESLHRTGILEGEDSPIKAKKTSQRPTNLFVRGEFAPPPDRIAQAAGAAGDDQITKLRRALALLPETQRTIVTLWADGLNCRAITAMMGKRETYVNRLLQEALDALRRRIDELNDGWPGDPPDQ